MPLCDLMSSQGFLPSRKCLGAPSPLTPLNGYTFTLFRLHPCRQGRSSIHLQAIHMHHCERLVSFPVHDDPSSIQYFGDEPGPEVLFADPASSCWGSPPCLLVASPGSSSGLGARARPTPASSLGTPPSGTGPVS